MDTNATGRFIAELRKEKGLTQKELAEKLQVTDKAVSRWETGKGLPDTSLLKPLCDILGVSVSELLTGNYIEEAEMKEQTEKIIVDSLNYSKNMFAGALNILIYIVGIALLLSPLFTSRHSFTWVLGTALLTIALFITYIRGHGEALGISRKTYYIAAIAFMGIALILEILPIGVVMIFPTDAVGRIMKICSHFSLLPWGYAHFTPMLTGLLTVSILLLGIIALPHFDKARKLRNAAFICSIIALLMALAPLLFLGMTGMTAGTYAVCGLIAISICLQAIANR